jgi:hypothetical protein
MAFNDFCACVDCDTTFTFPAISEEQNCTFDLEFSQVSGLILIPDGAPLPDDWTDRASWSGIVNNSNETNDAGKYISGEGGVDVPEKDLLEYPKRIEKVGKRVYAISFEVDNLSDESYGLLNGLQCGPTNFAVWIETVGGRLFGGPTGISPYFLDVDFPLEPGKDSSEYAVITILFEANCEPPRTDIEDIEDVFVSVGNWNTGANDWWNPSDEPWNYPGPDGP